MKTTLPAAITTVQEAIAFLTSLYNNGEVFHPEDDAHDIIWSTGEVPTVSECDQLNKLMEDIYKLPGNISPADLAFDPCEFLNKLNGMSDDEK